MFAASVVSSRISSEQFLHLRRHRGMHLDERRSGAFETFAKNFLIAEGQKTKIPIDVKFRRAVTGAQTSVEFVLLGNKFTR